MAPNRYSLQVADNYHQFLLTSWSCLLHNLLISAQTRSILVISLPDTNHNHLNSLLGVTPHWSPKILLTIAFWYRKLDLMNRFFRVYYQLKRISFCFSLLWKDHNLDSHLVYMRRGLRTLSEDGYLRIRRTNVGQELKKITW